MYRKYTLDKLDKYIEEIKNIDSDFVGDYKREYFILREDNILIAIASIEKIENRYYLKEIKVKEEYRFRSYGSKLIKQISLYLISKGIDKIYAEQVEDDKGFLYKNHFRVQNREMVLDSLLEDNKRRKEGIFGTLVSIIVNIFLSIFKIFFGILGNSKALVADGIHSISDVAGSIVILISIYMSSKPADEEHPRGHGKIESIAGTIVGIFLLITSFELVSNSIEGLLRGVGNIEKPNVYTIVVAIVSIVIKYSLYIYKNSMGLRLNNDAIIADAKDHRADVVSTFGVIIGIILAIYIHPIFDPVAGIAVSIFIAKEGLSIIKDTSDKILDTQDIELVNRIKKYANSFEEIYDSHDVILTYSGNKIYTSLHIRVDRNMTVDEAHRLADDLKYSLLSDFKDISDVIIHIDPLIS